MLGIDSYLKTTRPWRDNLAKEDKESFWLSFAPPHKPVSKPTITRWVMTMLMNAGVDTAKFKSHSLRAASSSKAFKAGLTTKDILERGNLKGDSVWKRHYHKNITTPAERYTTTLLGSSQEGSKLLIRMAKWRPGT